MTKTNASVGPAGVVANQIARMREEGIRVDDMIEILIESAEISKNKVAELAEMDPFHVHFYGERGVLNLIDFYKELRAAQMEAVAALRSQ